MRALNFALLALSWILMLVGFDQNEWIVALGMLGTFLTGFFLDLHFFQDSKP